MDAVEAFKDSQAFADAVAECSTDSYQLGFADCKEATAKFFLDLDPSKINPSGDEEVEEEKEETIVEDIADLIDALVEVQQVNNVDGSASVAPALAEAEEENASRQFES